MPARAAAGDPCGARHRSRRIRHPARPRGGAGRVVERADTSRRARGRFRAAHRRPRHPRPCRHARALRPRPRPALVARPPFHWGARLVCSADAFSDSLAAVPDLLPDHRRPASHGAVASGSVGRGVGQHRTQRLVALGLGDVLVAALVAADADDDARASHAGDVLGVSAVGRTRGPAHRHRTARQRHPGRVDLPRPPRARRGAAPRARRRDSLPVDAAGHRVGAARAGGHGGPVRAGAMVRDGAGGAGLGPRFSRPALCAGRAGPRVGRRRGASWGCRRRPAGPHRCVRRGLLKRPGAGTWIERGAK